MYISSVFIYLPHLVFFTTHRKLDILLFLFHFLFSTTFGDNCRLFCIFICPASASLSRPVIFFYVEVHSLYVPTYLRKNIDLNQNHLYLAEDFVALRPPKNISQCFIDFKRHSKETLFSMNVEMYSTEGDQ